ncbi:MAG TPA: GDSL-type esterase/lipase family protein [Micromonosporaceae bacterium]|nr:GDSL-type esterase/lipase family protein [Micromonosporaceae bacterium]
MRIPPRRQLLLAGVVVVAVVSTVFVAGASGRASGDRPDTWVGSWAMGETQAQAPPPAGKGLFDSTKGFNDQTVRMTIHTSVGGNAARIRLSNLYGSKALEVGHVTVAIPTKSGSGDAMPGSMHEVQFGGIATAVVPMGATLLSDPIPMTVAANSDLAVSLWLPTATGPATWHIIARSTTWIGKGDHAADISGASMSTKDTSWYYLTGVDVRNNTADGSVVVLGDSISDGFTATMDADHRWPDRLAARLDALPSKDHAPGVLDLGTAGSALGHDGAEFGLYELGPSAAGRLDSDVFAQTGARVVIVQLSINDIWIYHDGPDTLVGELRQVAAQIHEHGMKAYVCTISPWQGYRAWTAALDKTRIAENDWIRSQSDFDGFIDFDKLLADPETPTRLKPNWDSGDHIHPNDAGFQAMADYVSLDFLLS